MSIKTFHSSFAAPTRSHKETQAKDTQSQTISAIKYFPGMSTLRALATSSQDMRDAIMDGAYKYLAPKELDDNDVYEQAMRIFGNTDIAQKLEKDTETNVEAETEALQIAESSTSSPDDLHSIRFASKLSILIALAKNERSSKGTMRELYAQGQIRNLKGDSRLLKAVAKHHNTPGFLLDNLDVEKFSDELMENPETPGHLLNKMPLSRFWRELSQHKNTPPLLLRKLANWNKPELQRMLAKRAFMPTDNPEDLLRKAFSPFEEKNSVILRVEDQGEETLIAIPLDIAGQKKLIKEQPSEPLLEALAHYGPAESQLEAAKQKKLSSAVIHQLALSTWDKVRMRTVKHPDLDKKSATVFAFDTQPSIRAEAIKSGQLDDSMVEYMLDDLEIDVRKEIANRQILTNKMLDTLIRDKSPTVRKTLALNPCTPYKVVRYMVGDRNPQVSSAAGKALQAKGLSANYAMSQNFKQFLSIFGSSQEEPEDD